MEQTLGTSSQLLALRKAQTQLTVEKAEAATLNIVVARIRAGQLQKGNVEIVETFEQLLPRIYNAIKTYEEKILTAVK